MPEQEIIKSPTQWVKNRKAKLINNGKKLIYICTFNKLKIMNIFFKHKECHKFTWEARGHKSIFYYFVTNMITSKVIQDIRVYRNIELDTNHHLLCAKVNFAPQWVHKKQKKISVKQEFLKIRLLNDESTL
jgi:hypothetical protein